MLHPLDGRYGPARTSLRLVPVQAGWGPSESVSWDRSRPVGLVGAAERSLETL